MFYRLKRHLLTIFGDIWIYKKPLFIVYNPTSFNIKGFHTRKIMDILQPGDLVMRSYIHYLDGHFIPKGESDCSHSGLYVGDGKIVHAIAENVSDIDIIDFCRCDRILVLRPSFGQQWAIAHAKKCVEEKVPYDFDLESNNGKYYCHELIAECFPDLDIQPLSKPIPIFQYIGLTIASPVAYLSDSFFSNQHFITVYDSSEEPVR